ncbi:hypothetical protein [Thiobacter aerophilum]|uniref:Zorya protein ZorC EH domain-containing protein n=1 Tax=Thiobacter aerophilum TaxID=3121275 RepID=A0ABV0EEX5_9BURK
MFGFFSFKRKPTDPLTDVQSATRWMETLPLGNLYAANEGLVKALREYNQHQQAPSKDRIAALFTLDEGAQDILRALLGQYLLNPRMSRAVESRLWNAVFAYYQEILHAYHALVMDYVGNPSGSKVKPSLALIVARTVHYIGLGAKWCYFRYERVDPKLWKRLNKLYHLAEYEEIEREPLKLYETHDERSTSIAGRYLRILMLDAINNGTLLPRQLDLVDQWLADFTRELVLEKEFKPERHTFYVDLAEARGARRVRRVEASESKRYWGTFELKSHIDEIRAKLMKGEAPARLGLTEDCKLPACLELLDKVAALWSPTVKRTQRAHERRRVMQQIEVVRGLDMICASVKLNNDQVRLGGAGEGLSYEEMLDMHLYGFVTQRTRTKLAEARQGRRPPLPEYERWVVENESDGGFGALIDVQQDDWIRLGKLLGVKPERQGHWVVAVIRRMVQVSPNQYAVGLQILSQRPVALLLRASHEQPSGYTIDGVDAVDVVLPIPALYLKGERKAGQPDSLILPSAEFANGRHLWFSLHGTTYQIALNQALERGDDWLRVSFRLVTKVPAAGEAVRG